MRHSHISNSSGKLNYSKLFHLHSRSVKPGGNNIILNPIEEADRAAGRSFNHRSRSEIMHRNLKTGLMYVDKQKKNLTEIGNVIDAWRFAMKGEEKNRRHLKYNNLRNVVYIDPITRLIEEKFNNLQLFGDGTESAIRIHLMIEGIRYEFHLNVVPLLIDPGFQAIMHSGHSANYPSTGVFDLCCRHIINCMLTLEHNRTELDQKVKMVLRSRQKNLNFKALSSVSPFAAAFQENRIRSAIFNKVVNFFMTKFPISSMTGILLPLTLLKKF